ncbi:hypothetical protein D1159_12510 [Pseudoflavonifractor sp. 524-17]|uniref:cellulase family glycosylhydrolase n=1 Tax=Pseudoflavonifractor sp. 524-17 TaxID=2304577 RepID=UPI001379B7E0|nr:cellulase family glycosylhydrolase [Pseudoflavonifractor sp. 524-17]NCE65377.1 hypothetical protein [Pseudoflavonifractor sp. 524-17]
MRRSVFSLVLGVLCAIAVGLPVDAAGKGFSDVRLDSWYAGAVEEMADAGWLSGYPDGTFRPEQKISAAEFVSIVVRCGGLPYRQSGTGHWAAGPLQAALEAGWYDWDELPPTGEKYEQPISRQLAVKILMKALLPEVRGEYGQQAPKIKDLQALDGRYYEGVFAAYAAGVVMGDSAGCFHGRDGLTRAEACAIIQRAAAKRTGLPSDPGPAATPAPAPVPAEPIQRGVSENGWLQVKGTALCNEKGEPVVLRGMSSHGVHWYPQFTSRQAIANTAGYGANVFRVAMYTGEGGYLSQGEKVLDQTLQAVDAAIANDMYVIIDWHILSDGNPMSHLGEAKEFFDRVSARYGEEPAVLFEICNEPNGGVTWERDIKPYAEEIVGVIRKNAPKSVILIGSGTWSQDIHEAAADPVAGENLMYTCHFYAGTHGAWLRERIDGALAAGLPVFISEWGASAADGSSGVFLDASREWLDFLDQRGISWVNWSLCDKNETSAALRPGTAPDAQWTEKDLSESGQFVFSRLRLN